MIILLCFHSGGLLRPELVSDAEPDLQAGSEYSEY